MNLLTVQHFDTRGHRRMGPIPVDLARPADEGAADCIKIVNGDDCIGLAVRARPLDEEAGWKTTASGLQYLDEKPDVGRGHVVKVDYTGWLESDGKEFDTSIGRKPIAFAVGKGRVIPGWDEGILSMALVASVGSIPAELAYGENGAQATPFLRIRGFNSSASSLASSLASVPSRPPSRAAFQTSCSSPSSRSRLFPTSFPRSPLATLEAF